MIADLQPNENPEAKGQESSPPQKVPKAENSPFRTDMISLKHKEKIQFLPENLSSIHLSHQSVVTEVAVRQILERCWNLDEISVPPSSEKSLLRAKWFAKLCQDLKENDGRDITVQVKRIALSEHYDNIVSPDFDDRKKKICGTS